MAKQKTLEDFSRWFERHVGKWRWRERKPAEDAQELGHTTEGAAQTKGLATAQIQLELQRRSDEVDQAFA